MSSELSSETSDEASENELLDRSLSVWRGWSAIEKEDFTPVPLDLHTACSIGQYDWVRSIISKNESSFLDKKNKGGWTPLMYACYIGHDNIVNLLVKAGCQMNKMKNPRGHTPLMLAASCGNENVARALVRNEAELEVMDKSGWTALFHATYAGHQNFVDFLLEAGANINAVESTTGLSPFMLAAAEGHEIIVQLFLRHGVNVHAKAYNGDLARSIALIKGYMKIVSLIDNHVLPVSRLRSEPGLDFYLSSSDEDQPRKGRGGGQKKAKGPSIRDGPDAIARMIDRSRSDDMPLCTDALPPKGYMSFTGSGGEKGGTTQLSFREVTSPINPEDYKDTSGGTDFDDFEDDGNAFSKTGAITIKSSSSSSGGLVAALGLSREGSLDSDDSRGYDLLPCSTAEGIGYPADGTQECHGKEFTKVDGTTGSEEAGETDHESVASGNMKTIPVLKLPSKVDGPTSKQADNFKEKPRAVVSPLRDYFPLDESFPPVSEASGHLQVRNALDVQSPQSAPTLAEPNFLRQPPLDNMSQSEIVTAYLSSMPMGSGRNNSQLQAVWDDNVCQKVAASRQDRFVPVREMDTGAMGIEEQFSCQDVNNRPSKPSVNPPFYSDEFSSHQTPPQRLKHPESVPWSNTEFRHVKTSHHNVDRVAIGARDAMNYHVGHFQPASTHILPSSYPLPLSSPHDHYRQDHHRQHHQHQSNPHFIHQSSCSVYYPPHSNTGNILFPHVFPSTPHQQTSQQPHQYPYHNQQMPPPPPPTPQPPSALQNLGLGANHLQAPQTSSFYKNSPQDYYGAPPGHPSFDPASYFKTIPSDIYYSDMNAISALQFKSKEENQNQQHSSEVMRPSDRASENDKAQENKQSCCVNDGSKVDNYSNHYQQTCDGYEHTSGNKAFKGQTQSNIDSYPKSNSPENNCSNIIAPSSFSTPPSSYSSAFTSIATAAASTIYSKPAVQFDRLPQVSCKQSTTPRPVHRQSEEQTPMHHTPLLSDLNQLHHSPQPPNSLSSLSSLQQQSHVNCGIYNPLPGNANNFYTLSGIPNTGIEGPTTSNNNTPVVVSAISNVCQSSNQLKLQSKSQSSGPTITPHSKNVDLGSIMSTNAPTVSSFNSVGSTKNLSNPIPVTSTSPSPNSANPIPNSVMIPGHTKSQPVSQSIGWLEQESRERGVAKDLPEMLTQLGLSKYLEKFEEQDVDLQVFLSLTDNDLKEVGIKLLGPRKKMANGIARWHSQAPLPSSNLEQAYADRLEGEMQELAIQLNQAYATEERLKAQVLQEQQLRSVTESCLMEAKGHWEKTRQAMEEAQTTMKSIGESIARLRLNSKEMRKEMDEKIVTGIKSAESPTTTSSLSPQSPPSSSSLTATTTTAPTKGGLRGELNSATGSGVVKARGEDLTNKCKVNERSMLDSKLMEMTRSSQTEVVSSPIFELIRKSDQYAKEIDKALSSLMCNADAVLKSTKDLSSLNKGLEDI